MGDTCAAERRLPWSVTCVDRRLRGARRLWPWLAQAYSVGTGYGGARRHLSAGVREWLKRPSVWTCRRRRARARVRHPTRVLALGAVPRCACG
jgi:hypothetical protein